MTINVSLNQLVNLQNENTAVTQINQNSNILTTGFVSALNTAGDQMQGTLDMNSNQVINLPTPATANSPARLQDLSTVVGGGTVSNIPSGGASGQVLIKSGTTPFITAWGNAGTTNIAAGTGLTLSGTTLSVTNTAVASGSYGTAASVPVLTINAQGQITSATTVAAVAGGGAASGTFGATGTTVQIIVNASGNVSSVTSVNIGISGSQIISGTVPGSVMSSMSLGAGNVNGGVTGALPFTNMVGIDIAAVGTVTAGVWNVTSTNLTTANLTAVTGNITSMTSTTITSTNLKVSSSATMPDSSVWNATGIVAASGTGNVLVLSSSGMVLTSVSTGVNVGYLAVNYGANAVNSFQTASGTPTSPTALTSGALIAALAFSGYTGTGFSSPKSRLVAVNSETGSWTATSNGCGLEFDTTASGTTSRVQAMRVQAGVTIGSATTDPGVGNIALPGATIYSGTGAPTSVAPQGSIYLRSDGTALTGRMYINTSGASTWTNVTTAG